jgi:hypothetical protein
MGLKQDVWLYLKTIHECQSKQFIAKRIGDNQNSVRKDPLKAKAAVEPFSCSSISALSRFSIGYSTSRL